jgi:NADPH2:quinone reductase
MSANVLLRFVLLYGVPPSALETAVTDITAALEAGALSALPTHRFSMGDAAGAHEAVEAGVVGKVLVEVA